MPNQRDYDNIDEYDRDMDLPLRTYTIPMVKWEAPLSDFEWNPTLRVFVRHLTNGWPDRDQLAPEEGC